MAGYLANLQYKFRRCDCSLKTWGFIAGWLGVVLRTVAIIVLAIVIAKTTEDSSAMDRIALIIVLAYVQFSLVTNLFLIVGIQKEKPYFMLGYITIGVLELFIGLTGLIGGILILHGMNWDYLLCFFIPAVILFTGIYFFLWIQCINLFRNMEVEINIKREDNARIASIRQSYFNSPIAKY
ncbi:hypothetical protein NQ318_001709 [Aromia moschata]|uniref:Uncharacterized protein n=1 Tax=Aromia moschata TaxID=1265417 RepID=A0AAV8XW65_9CUCU|nr:hypothetical protein NQ318_001709 [Aromia moschata]